MRKVICTNAEGQELVFTEGEPPYFLLSLDGIYDIRHNVTTAKGFAQDGERFTGSNADKRNIVITTQIKSDYQRRRDELYNFFQPEETGTFCLYDGNVARMIDYVVENITNPEMGAVRHSAVSLICPDPLFRDPVETRLSLARRQGNISFPLNIVNPFEVATKITSQIESIYNPTNTTLGLRARFKASGEVVRPQIVDINRQKYLVVGITMHAGDVLEITTTVNAKRAMLTHEGVRTNVINSIEYPPQWPMILKGDNVFQYDAAAGFDALEVDFFYYQTYWGC